MKPLGTMILKRNEISSLLTLEDCTSVVEDAFKMHAEGKTLAPGLLHIDSHDGEFHIKAGGLSLEQTYFALKANGGFFQNMARYGLPNIQGVILLFDGDKGYPLAVMDSMEITIKRTGAATAVAAKYLARPDSAVATVCGCGNQGRIQLEALKQALPEITQVFAFDLDEQRATLYASDMSRELAITVEAAATLEDAARRSDVIVTCTPVFPTQRLCQSRHVRRGHRSRQPRQAGIGAKSAGWEQDRR
jgi:alanine dehydrogenase